MCDKNFILWCQKTIPLVFDNSMSYYENLCKLVNYINSLTTDVKEIARLQEELQNYVDNYFTNLDVQNEINNKLDEMVNDGTFDNLITNLLLFPQNYVEIEKIGRIIDETFMLNENTNGYFGMQGGALIDNDTLAFIVNHHNSNNSYADENSKIRKISLTTGNILQETILEIGHGNGFCYDKEKQLFYITSGHGNINENLFNKQIIILNSDLSIKETIPVEYNYDSIFNDEENNLYAGITFKNDPDGKSNTIFQLSKEDFSIIKEINLDMPISNEIGTGNNFCVFKNVIYYLQYNPSSIYAFDLTGKCIKIYNLNNNGFINIGEPQNINVTTNGDFIIGCAYEPNGNLYNISQFLKINPFKGIIKNKDLPNMWNIRNLYVDSTKMGWNPDGSSQNPYYCLDEITANNYNYPIYINLINNQTYYVSKFNSTNINIIGNGGIIKCGNGYNKIDIRNSNINFNNLTIDSLEIQINSIIKINNCTINQTNNDCLINNQNSSITNIENTSFSINKDITTVLKNTGLLFIIDKNFIMPSVDSIFDGEFITTKALNLYNDETGVSINETLDLKNNISGFKHLILTFTDLNTAVIPIPKNTTVYNFSFSNLSTAGTGNNNFYNITLNVYPTNNQLKITKTNQITFNSSGEMSVNTSPNFKLLKVDVE